MLLAILSPGTLSVDFCELEACFGKKIGLVVEKVLERLSKDSKFVSASDLKKIQILQSPFSPTLNDCLFRILEKYATTLTSLTIQAYPFICPHTLTFPNVTELSLRLGYTKKSKLLFLQHSNYTVLKLYGAIFTIEGPDKKQYFGKVGIS